MKFGDRMLRKKISNRDIVYPVEYGKDRMREPQAAKTQRDSALGSRLSSSSQTDDLPLTSLKVFS